MVFSVEKPLEPNLKWMIWRDPHDLGNLHMAVFSELRLLYPVTSPSRQLRHPYPWSVAPTHPWPAMSMGTKHHPQMFGLWHWLYHIFMILICPNVRSYGYCYHHSSYCELSSFWWYCWVLLVESLLSFIHGENTQFMVIHLTIRLLRIRLGKWIDLHPLWWEEFLVVQ